MSIVQRAAMRAAVARALWLDPQAGIDAAMHAVAQALCLPIEAVQEAVAPAAEETAS